MKRFRIDLLLALMFSAAIATAIQEKPAAPKPATPTLTDAERTSIRKFQLDDVRIANSIQQQWLQIYQSPPYQTILNLQKQQEANVKGFQAFIAGLCKEPGWQFDQTSDDLRCVRTPAPTPTPEKK